MCLYMFLSLMLHSLLSNFSLGGIQVSSSRLCLLLALVSCTMPHFSLMVCYTSLCLDLIPLSNFVIIDALFLMPQPWLLFWRNIVTTETFFSWFLRMPDKYCKKKKVPQIMSSICIMNLARQIGNIKLIDINKIKPYFLKPKK